MSREIPKNNCFRIGKLNTKLPPKRFRSAHLSMWGGPLDVFSV